jgi:hypothetical protein
MYSCIVARIKSEDEYDWLQYKGKPLEIPFRGITRTLETGQKIGVRKSSNGKQIRMVFDGDLNRVMTLDLALARSIAKNVSVVRAR